jgi:hypothetical protein
MTSSENGLPLILNHKDWYMISVYYHFMFMFIFNSATQFLSDVRKCGKIILLSVWSGMF